MFAGCDWADSPAWRFETCHGFTGVSATQQEEDKKGGFGGRRKKSQRIKNKSTEGSSSSSSLSRPRRLKGQRSETAGRTYLVPPTLVHWRRLPKPIAPNQKHTYTRRARKVNSKLRKIITTGSADVLASAAVLSIFWQNSWWLYHFFFLFSKNTPLNMSLTVV